MALLQIAEPGLSAAPHQHRLAVGIDLGTTHSLVATVVSSGVTRVLPDADGRVLVPSVVRYGELNEDNPISVGHSAQAEQVLDPRNTIVSVKRFMGQGGAGYFYPQQPLRICGFPRHVELEYSRWGKIARVQVSAEILKVLRAKA